MTAKQWIDCPCGESICAPDSDFGRAVVAAWKAQHMDHVNGSL